MNIVKTAARLPEYAADVKNSVVELFSSTPKGLTEAQVHGVALTAAYFLKHDQLLNDIRSEAKLYLDERDADACKISVVMMAMTNTYYSAYGCDKEIDGEDSPLSFNKLANPGVDMVDFELYCLAASALHKCRSGIEYHIRQLKEHGVDKEGIRNVIYIVSVLRAVAEALNIESVRSYEFIARRSSL